MRRSLGTWRIWISSNVHMCRNELGRLFERHCACRCAAIAELRLPLADGAFESADDIRVAAIQANLREVFERDIRWRSFAAQNKTQRFGLRIGIRRGGIT